jgi:hypothetical protein
MTEMAVARRKVFRKSLVIPAEHGSWSWLLVPFFVGAAVAGIIAGDNVRLALLPLVLTLGGGLCAFLVRQPATAWLRIRQGRARRADEPLAAGWTLGLALAAGLCLVGLLALGRTSLLWLVIPFAAVLLFYLAAARSGRAGMRALRMELIGAVGLALMAPAAVIAATGRLSGPIWALWGLMGMQNALGVLYVRLRLADTHQQPAGRSIVVWGHAIGLAAVAIAGALAWVPLPAAFPFLGVLLRAVWAVRQSRPVLDVRRFGFTEVGVEVLSGAWIAAAYWMS